MFPTQTYQPPTRDEVWRDIDDPQKCQYNEKRLRIAALAGDEEALDLLIALSHFA